MRRRRCRSCPLKARYTRTGRCRRNCWTLRCLKTGTSASPPSPHRTACAHAGSQRRARRWRCRRHSSRRPCRSGSPASSAAPAAPQRPLRSCPWKACDMYPRTRPRSAPAWQSHRQARRRRTDASACPPTQRRSASGRRPFQTPSRPSPWRSRKCRPPCRTDSPAPSAAAAAASRFRPCCRTEAPCR